MMYMHCTFNITFSITEEYFLSRFDEIWPGFVLQATPFAERKGVVVHAAVNELIGHKFCHGDNSMVVA